ncbi:MULTISPECIES: tail fiber assembly protein [unclassified Pseudomonas]|uniref:tail fiber assembly protein n=1 Tax=unclassified Pseudomonas TaxID=196821 RepID=UPI000A1F7847|nr:MULTISPECIES: tail fiber assembly protein [unclassified Pseudomonas]
MGYALRKDGSAWRAVDGPKPDKLDPSKSFPDPDFEVYSVEQPPLPMPSEAEVLTLAKATRDDLLKIATLRIDPLQDAVDRKKATAAEVDLLNRWKDYRIDLGRIEQQKGFPTSIEWPSAP